MSAFSGKQSKGAMRDRRAKKRAEAEARNALTLPSRRSTKRFSPEERLLHAIYGEAA